MKYDGYDVYDIIYRNDSGVKKLLEKDPLYRKTGFLALQDAEGRIWYLYKEGGMLIPQHQEYLERTYGRRDMLPNIRRIKIGKDECQCSWPAEEFARDFFVGLSKIDACSGWKIGMRLWKIQSDSAMLYDARARMVRPEQYVDRVNILRCAYASDRNTKRRNFSSFADWEYLPFYEKEAGSDGKAGAFEDLPAGTLPAGTKEGTPKRQTEGGAFADSAKQETARSEKITIMSLNKAADQEKPIQSLTSAEHAAGEALVGGLVTEKAPSEEAAIKKETSGEAAFGKESPKAALPQESDSEKAAFVDIKTGGIEVGDKAPEKEESVFQKREFPDVRELLECDKRRCRLEAYDENMLYDIKRGHWDLYGWEDSAENSEKGRLVARDPRKDIRPGVVGIDFGTKSTVVVRQEDTSAITPIRIGAEVLSASLKESDYENPTIIECTNLDGFLKKYDGREGRPQTSCEDFFVSYDAYHDYRECPPSEFYAYYADLKQWANHEKENVAVLDKQKQEYRFGAETSREERSINPIELYAYYIGLYINNMRNGIYLKYLMSFPVGYSKETRKLIVTSFEKGIRKSLPACVLEDEECMKEFSVSLGVSEPAAYAVTALEMSGLDPEDENDRYRYGIFDFGGGTADFGFGIWRGASEDEYEVEGYDYVLECFGADSDVTLGGEKILELLAYAVFRKNRELARRKRITCSLPFGERTFPGSEALISDSQIARRNMAILKEELRPLWHQEKNWEQKYRHGLGGGGLSGEAEEYIEITMYDVDGNEQPDCKFVVDTEELITLIKDRIQKGIDAFFKCMAKAFRREEDAQEDGAMYIFLAGNSSKSVFVRELFEKNIQDYSYRRESACFKLMEPLGAGSDVGYEYVQNAKTSVAYGLIKSREGSSVKVEKNFETDAEEQTRFQYYLGRERKRHFDCRLSPVETEYGKWIRFQGAAKQTVRIYYTTDPTADVREEPPMIDKIPYREIAVEPKKGAFLFIRACEPTVIEYTVSLSEEEIGKGGEINRMDFFLF